MAADPLPFAKMHANGNDFMLLDLIRHPRRLTAAWVRAWGDRRQGVGFDQLLTLEPPQDAGLDFSTRVFNSDGGEVGFCLNGARCLADWALQHGYGLGDSLRLGFVDCGVRLERGADGGWSTLVPLHGGGAPAELPGLDDPAWRVQLGNPHAVVDVSARPDAFLDEVDLHEYARQVQRKCAGEFPQGFNLSLIRGEAAQVRSRVLERGAGETLSCGSAAIAVGLTQLHRHFAPPQLHNSAPSVEIRTPGGMLRVSLQGPAEGEDGPVARLEGPTALVYEGVLPAPAEGEG